MSGGYYQFQSPQLRVMPFKRPPKSIDGKVSELVYKILAKKKHDHRADTAELESEIDQQVYELYDLTENEIAIVEGSMKP